MVQAGDTIPDATLATIDDNSNIHAHSAHDLFNHGRFVLIGIPGAFTPVCTKEHLPEIIDNADNILAQDISAIYCISDDNPWALQAWRERLPGYKAITFLSDGNREFLNATGWRNQADDMFVGGRFARFFAIIENKKVITLRMENNVKDVTCSTGKDTEIGCT